MLPRAQRSLNGWMPRGTAVCPSSIITDGLGGDEQKRACRSEAAADKSLLYFFESAIPALLNVTNSPLLFAQNSLVRNGGARHVN